MYKINPNSPEPVVSICDRRAEEFICMRNVPREFRALTGIGKARNGKWRAGAMAMIPSGAERPPPPAAPQGGGTQAHDKQINNVARALRRSLFAFLLWRCQ